MRRRSELQVSVSTAKALRDAADELEILLEMTREMSDASDEDLLELVMRRYERASTLLTSNRPVDDWGKLLGDHAGSRPVVVGAVGVGPHVRERVGHARELVDHVIAEVRGVPELVGHARADVREQDYSRPQPPGWQHIRRLGSP